MRRSVLLAAVAALSFVAWSRGDDDREKKADPLDGLWQMTAAELAGNKLPKEFAESVRMEIKGDHYVVTTAEGKDEGTCRIISGKKPGALDIKGTNGPNKGRTLLAIYQRDGDTLRVCYDLDGKKRPTEFKTKPETTLFLATYRRQK